MMLSLHVTRPCLKSRELFCIFYTVHDEQFLDLQEAIFLYVFFSSHAGLNLHFPGISSLPMERLKQAGISHCSSVLLEDGGQLFSTGVQTGWCHTIWAWCLSSLVLSEDLTHIIFTDLKHRRGRGGLQEVLMVVWRDGQSVCTVLDGQNGCGEFQIYSKTHPGLQQVIESPQCRGMVSCSW